MAIAKIVCALAAHASADIHAYPGAAVRPCDGCGADIITSKTSREAAAQGTKLFCVSCAGECKTLIYTPAQVRESVEIGEFVRKRRIESN